MVLALEDALVLVREVLLLGQVAIIPVAVVVILDVLLGARVSALVDV